MTVPRSVLGLFDILGAPEVPVGGDSKKDKGGASSVVECRITTPDAILSKEAVLDLWQTTDNGLYSCHDESQPEYNFAVPRK
ncbi:hypothetical protein [Falsihalocynthiibacter arcticus]|uniref:Intradiol ring-cleavage dioxygenases domain-containing protein n=1 Tax=Falsihalocynthiibacter arcticus TaxID=1579316 RepID=A0A126V114_9RHOB|nr:hypothetical protein [Falsihalocynthiibacter arcticus]AML52021.1 hypothetical protein RC74_12735 [Falsihalocynthiibacter arcticus]